MILRVTAKNSRRGSILAVACRKSGGTLENGLEFVKTGLLAGTGEKCVLNNGVLYVVLTELLSELGVVLSGLSESSATIAFFCSKTL